MRRRPIHMGPQQPQPRPGPNQSGQTGQQQGPAQTVQQQRPPVVYTDVQVSTETSELDKQAQQNLLQLQLGGDEFLVGFLSYRKFKFYFTLINDLFILDIFVLTTRKPRFVRGCTGISNV